VSTSAADHRIRSLRPPKPRVDPFVAHGSTQEQERRPDGTIEETLTVFVAGAECPFTCSFCDLWRYTIDGPTPPGALTQQLREVLDHVAGEKLDRLKLYNASNFFDPHAVPPADVLGIAELAGGFSSVTVESHVSTIGERTSRFARALTGRLEVALGLETIHPTASRQLNKRLDLARFDRAADFLRDHAIDMRVFVLLGAPYVPARESIEWTVRSVEYALERGAAVVSVIPVRGGNGELERLQSLGEFTAPSLRDLEEVIASASRLHAAVVTADLWDADHLPAPECCRALRVDRLRRWNLTGELEPRVSCTACSTPGAA
jgi:radical SAM enzyme (TIGR01210 family)